MLKKIFAAALFITTLSGCTSNHNELEKKDHSIVIKMSELVSYELDQMEPEHEEQIRKWLNDVQQNGGEKQYFIHSFDSETADNMYAYVYGKGFADYEVSFNYNTLNNRAEVHVAGIEGHSETDHFVKIKMINDQSITVVLSEETLAEKKLDESSH